MQRLVDSIWVSVLALCLCGCTNEFPRTAGGPFGPPSKSELLSPFAGDWVFDAELTYDARIAAGSSEEEIERLRNFFKQNLQFGQMHGDMSITGNVATCSGLLPAEYRFFAMHPHDGKVCGKAWHHEDRFDPGDMSKCFVRMSIEDDCLHLEVRMKDGLPDLNDPDLQSAPDVEGGTAANCDADNPAGSDWSEWSTFVFRRKK